MLYQLNYGRKMVGLTGFEPATLCSQSRCATKLRYSPNLRVSRLPEALTSIEQYRDGLVRRQMRPAGPQTVPASLALSTLRAAPRWLIAFFSARESSAIVRPGVASGRKSGS
jgi:hypothetical protein